MLQWRHQALAVSNTDRKGGSSSRTRMLQALILQSSLSKDSSKLAVFVLSLESLLEEEDQNYLEPISSPGKSIPRGQCLCARKSEELIQGRVMEAVKNKNQQPCNQIPSSTWTTWCRRYQVWKRYCSHKYPLLRHMEEARESGKGKDAPEKASGFSKEPGDTEVPF